MPASNDMRVRVDGFSKIIASVRSSSGQYLSYFLNFALIHFVRAKTCSCSAREKSLNCRKCRSFICPTLGRDALLEERLDQRHQPLDHLAAFRLAHDQRRQQADDVVR